MNAKVIYPTGNITENSVVSFSYNKIKQLVDVEYHGKQERILSYCIVATEPESIEELEFLHALSIEIEKHRSIIIFDYLSQISKYGGYMFKDEVFLVGDICFYDMDPCEVLKRRVYRKLTEEIAKESGLDVYCIKHSKQHGLYILYHYDSSRLNYNLVNCFSNPEKAIAKFKTEEK